MALTTQHIKLKFTGIEIFEGDNGIHCIKSFPELNPNGEPDQVEITTLCDEYHEYIDGLKNFQEPLEFPANYNEEVFGYLNGLSEYETGEVYDEGDVVRKDGIVYQCNTDGTTGTWNSTKWDAVVVEILFCERNDITGKNGKFTIAKADISMKVSGGGVGDVLEMVYVIKPRSEIVFSTVA